MDAKMLSVPGRHNVYNALKSFGGGRLSWLGSGGGDSGAYLFPGTATSAPTRVPETWGLLYNDSKATNPHVASVGLAIERNQIVITGGYEKNLDLSPFIGALGRARQVYTVGLTRLTDPCCRRASSYQNL